MLSVYFVVIHVSHLDRQVMPIGWFCWNSLVGGSLSCSCQYLSRGSYKGRLSSWMKLLEDLTSGCWARSTLSLIDARCAAWLPLPQRSKCTAIIEATCLMIQLLHVFLVVAAGILNMDGV